MSQQTALIRKRHGSESGAN